MLFRTPHHRLCLLLLAVFLTAAGLLGFSGLPWCADWRMAADSRMELASCHAGTAGSMKLALLRCGQTESSGTNQCAICPDKNPQSLSGWRMADDRPKASFSNLPVGSCSSSIRLAKISNFAGTSLSILVAAKTSPPGLSIQAEALRSVVLLI